MVEKDEYGAFIPNPSDVPHDMQNAGTTHGKLWFKIVPDFLKAVLIANGYKSYSELAEDAEGDD